MSTHSCVDPHFLLSRVTSNPHHLKKQQNAAGAARLCGVRARRTPGDGGEKRLPSHQSGPEHVVNFRAVREWPRLAPPRSRFPPPWPVVFCDLPTREGSGEGCACLRHVCRVIGDWSCTLSKMEEYTSFAQTDRRKS